MAATTTTTSTKNALHVVVIGGGPAGAATALSLGQQGHIVHLFEAYPHPLQIEKNAPKAYGLSLGKRGLDGLLDATGITPESITGGILSRTFVRHPAKKVTQRQLAVPVPRKVLAAYILDRCAALDGQVTIHYEHRLVDIDFNKREALVFDRTKPKSEQQQRTVAYDLLVGCDGSNSMVRTLMDTQLKNFQVLRSEADTMEYQVVTLPSHPFPELPKEAMHAWNNKAYNSISISYPLVSSSSTDDDDDGGMIFGIVFPEGKFNEFRTKHAENVGDGKEGTYDHALSQLFSDLNEATRNEIKEQLFKGTPANGGTCIWNSSLGSAEHGIVLIGDSGHGMWPSLGQGANCALESVAIFCRTCRNIISTSSAVSPQQLVRAIIQQFDEKRLDDAHAAVDLTFGGIGSTKCRGQKNAPLSYKLQVMGMMLLNKITLGIVPKPALIRLMTGETISYSTAKSYNFHYEKIICVSALVALALPILAWYY